MAQKNARCGLPFKKAFRNGRRYPMNPSLDSLYIGLAFTPELQATLPALMPFYIQAPCQNRKYRCFPHKVLKLKRFLK
ncbi:hypothetical protein [Thalassospira australica]|uniref:hypothetical protein n=1 Tax=Thalassospira australica TaxID=1528106 RepID=UPI0012E0174B|nr:hypothetical protein [Thalassospira australica]